MNEELDRLRREHEEEFIGRALEALLARVAAATCRTYPPSYSDAGVWNAEAVQDALHDWTAERLIRRADLTTLLLGASSVASLRAGLTRSLRQFLTNRRRRTTATNLYKRVVQMLRDSDRFVAVTTGPEANEQLWSVQRAPLAERSQEDLRTLLRVAAELDDEELGVVRYGPHSLKSSPVLRKPGLERFLDHLLAGAAGSLTPADIMDVMRLRFDLVEPELVPLDEHVWRHEAVDDRIDDRLAAVAVVTRLGHDTAEAVLAAARAGSFAAAADDLGIPEERLRQHVWRATGLVAEHARDEEEARSIYGLVVETLFGEGR